MINPYVHEPEIRLRRSHLKLVTFEKVGTYDRDTRNLKILVTENHRSIYRWYEASVMLVLIRQRAGEGSFLFDLKANIPFYNKVAHYIILRRISINLDSTCFLNGSECKLIGIDYFCYSFTFEESCVNSVVSVLG